MYWIFLLSNATTCLCGGLLPPERGSSVTDFWVWDAHEAQLRCPDDVSGDIGGCCAMRALKPNLPRPWSPRESSPSVKFPTVESGIEPGTSRLVVQTLWPLDRDAGHVLDVWNSKCELTSVFSIADVCQTAVQGCSEISIDIKGKQFGNFPMWKVF